MERERYSSSGDYSVTDLINPARVVRLKKRYGESADQPLSSMIPAMLGTAIHEYFEKYLKLWVVKSQYPNLHFEEQLTHSFQVGEVDRTVSGRYDIRDGGHMYDIKSCKVWKLIYDPDMKEWHEQQNLYDYLCYLNDIHLESINIIALYKDWQEGNALRNRDYPQTQIAEYGLTRWDRDTQLDFLFTNLAKHVACEETQDDQLPPCTREERWERFPDGAEIHYAVMKTQTAKRAARVFKGGTLSDAMAQAKAKVRGLSSDSMLEVRYATRTRCERYCAVNEWCNDYQAYMKDKKNETLNDYIKIIL